MPTTIVNLNDLHLCLQNYISRQKLGFSQQLLNIKSTAENTQRKYVTCFITRVTKITE